MAQDTGDVLSKLITLAAIIAAGVIAYKVWQKSEAGKAQAAAASTVTAASPKKARVDQAYKTAMAQMATMSKQDQKDTQAAIRMAMGMI